MTLTLDPPSARASTRPSDRSGDDLPTRVQAHLDFRARQAALDLSPGEAHPDFGDETLRMAFLEMLRTGDWHGQICQSIALNVRDVLRRQQGPQQPGFLFASATGLHGLFWTPDRTRPALVQDQVLPAGWLYLGQEAHTSETGPRWLPNAVWAAVSAHTEHLWQGETLDLSALTPGSLNAAALNAAKKPTGKRGTPTTAPRRWDRALLYPEDHQHLATLSPERQERFTSFFTRKNLLERFCPVISSHVLILRRIETRCGRMILSYSPGPHPERWNTTCLYTLVLDGRVVQRDRPDPQPGLDALDAFVRREYRQEIEQSIRPA